MATSGICAFPPALWEGIFGCLSPFEFARVQRTCTFFQSSLTCWTKIYLAGTSSSFVWSKARQKLVEHVVFDPKRDYQSPLNTSITTATLWNSLPNFSSPKALSLLDLRDRDMEIKTLPSIRTLQIRSQDWRACLTADNCHLENDYVIQALLNCQDLCDLTVYIQPHPPPNVYEGIEHLCQQKQLRKLSLLNDYRRSAPLSVENLVAFGGLQELELTKIICPDAFAVRLIKLTLDQPRDLRRGWSETCLRSSLQEIKVTGFIDDDVLFELAFCVNLAVVQVPVHNTSLLEALLVIPKLAKLHIMPDPLGTCQNLSLMLTKEVRALFGRARNLTSCIFDSYVVQDAEQLRVIQSQNCQFVCRNCSFKEIIF